MDDEKARTLREIDEAFRQEGFLRDSQSPFPSYIGELDRSGLRIPVSVEIQDLDFVKAPVVRFIRSQEDRFRPIAHIAGPGGVLCYLDTNATVLDRYNPSGTVLRCLMQAEEVLRDALRGKSHQDFAGEFLSYWGENSALVDLPEKFQGEARIHWLSLHDPKFVIPLLTSGDVPTSFLQAHRMGSKSEIPPRSESCQVVLLSDDLTAHPDCSWPLDNIGALKSWLDTRGPKAGGCLEEVMKSGDGTRRWIALKAPNGCAIAVIKIPAMYDKPEFLTNRRESLLSNLLRSPGLVTVERYKGYSVDENYLYSRNLGGLTNLAGKSIVLIGCGTIGGFLAKLLAQSGAGSLGGNLLLIDDDDLQAGNLGRHYLGVEGLGWNKAQACKDRILRELPHLMVSAEKTNALQLFERLSRFSLVIDATGDEAFSIALNHYMVRLRPRYPVMLYVWLEGNGSMARTLLWDGPDHACYKCLKVNLAGQPRFRAVRSEEDIRVDSNRPCGDGLFVPFPVSRSIAAAALGLEAALGWINGRSEPRLRNCRLAEQAFNLKDSNPDPSPTCPGCRNIVG